LLVTLLAQGHQVALVGTDVDQLMRLEKAGNGRVLVILRASQLDREIEITPVIEPKAHDRVGDRRHHPMNQKQVERSQL